MEGSPLIQSLHLTGLLSYGPNSEPVELGPLNVLIGPNASGKSNLIQGLSLLRGAAGDLAGTVRQGGGIPEWLWKGPNSQGTGQIEARVSFPEGPGPLRYRLRLATAAQRLEVVAEAVENADALPGDDFPVSFFQVEEGKVVSERARPEAPVPPTGGVTVRGRGIVMKPGQSILSLLAPVPSWYPEVSFLGGSFREIRTFSNWDLGPNSPLHAPQKVDLPSDFLLEDASNLGLVLNDLEHGQEGLQAVMGRLQSLYEPVERITMKVQGGTAQVYVHERGLAQPIPTSRMSDGMLRYLCLLAILCHPSPPPLICIEEPELGLHPDVLGTVAELLVEASRRTQLIVTTHSDILVSALNDVPEAILVCERDEDGTHLRRLEKDKLEEWLEDYTLGDLWLRGKLGGTTT